MGPFATFSLFLFVLQAASAVDPPTALSSELGASVDLPTGLPKGSPFATLTLHSLTRRKGIALLVPGQPLRVLSPQYSKRVAFAEDAGAFRIENLGLADTGTYDIYLQTSEEPAATLRTYTLFVFNVSVSAARLANSSCGLDLRCEVGSRGARYTWKDTASGETLAQGGHLRLLLHPENSRDAYTCTARDAGGQGFSTITPYQRCPPVGGAAGSLMPGLCLLGAALVALGALL